MAATHAALYRGLANRLERVEATLPVLVAKLDQLLAQGTTRVSEPVVEVKASRRSRADRVAEANPLIRPERAKHGRKCACGRSMSKERNGTLINGRVVCHYCWTHR